MTDPSRHLFGIDIGGSGIKARVVDTATGELLSHRFEARTPRPAIASLVVPAVAEIVEAAQWAGPVGITFPGVVTSEGFAKTAANLDPSWIDSNLVTLFSEAMANPVAVLNDADAAALAEARFGAAMGETGTVLVVTFGTGIGTGLLRDGRLIPNIELGHLELGGMLAEHRYSSAARIRDGLTLHEWGTLLNTYLAHVCLLLSPDLIVIGGGISRDFSEYARAIQLAVPVVPARFRNEAGIVGAALAAADGPILSVAT